MTDEQLRVDAVERAYRDHADDVYRVAYAILRDPDGAMDATQDAFAQAFRRWEQYDSNRPVRPWLHGIVTHLALDAMRRRRVRIKAIDAIAKLIYRVPGRLAVIAIVAAQSVMHMPPRSACSAWARTSWEAMRLAPSHR